MRGVSKNPPDLPPLNIVWDAQPGSQKHFLQCPIFEVLFEGTRGPGKTDALLMDFAQFCNKGFGENWRGILFRQTYPQLADVVAKSKRWFYRMFPGIRYNGQEHAWTWPTGEQLLLRHMRVEDDYWNYHGHEYPWIGWEELTNWPDAKCYEAMKSCSRSSHPGMPRRYRGTGNPYGIGHHWLKRYFVDPAAPGVVVREPGRPDRVRIHGTVYENKKLLAADPEYIQKLQSITDPNKRKAWLDGSWDITSGGLFDDLWSPAHHVLKPFVIPFSWRIFRSFDWGLAKPFSVGWWAEADGTEAKLADGTRRTFVRGSLIRIAEWYGCVPGQDNVGLRLTDSKIALGIVAREKAMGIHGRSKPGPADNAIFDEVNGDSPALQQAKHKVYWDTSDKSPGSRIRGWSLVRARLEAAAAQWPEPAAEEPGLYVFDNCRDFIRTFPSLPRDEVKLDDSDPRAEDHVADETRYTVLGSKYVPLSLSMGVATNG